MIFKINEVGLTAVLVGVILPAGSVCSANYLAQTQALLTQCSVLFTPRAKLPFPNFESGLFLKLSLSRDVVQPTWPQVSLGEKPHFKSTFPMVSTPNV